VLKKVPRTKDYVSANYLNTLSEAPLDSLTTYANFDKLGFMRDFFEEYDPDSGFPEDDVITTEATGELAERIRRAFGVRANAKVFLTERVTYGGTVETLESFQCFEIRSGKHMKEFDELRCMPEDIGKNGLVLLLEWLDRDAPKV
jgi:hypothetical protein